VEAVEREFGTAVEPWLPKGGIYLWMKLPDQIDVRKLVQPALKAGIAFNPGPEWAVDGNAAKSRLRLCFALTTKEEIRDGVAAFGMRDLDTGSPITLGTLFRIASMTKAITSVAAMQLVEQQKIGLDDPVPDIDPALARPQLLDGVDAAGQPRLRPAERPITLRHLLTHTAGFTYDWSNPNTARYAELTGLPPTSSGKLAALGQPLAFEPGERWEYGINIDWVGRIVEALSGKTLDTYLREHVCGPLGMDDTGFAPTGEQ